MSFSENKKKRIANPLLVPDCFSSYMISHQPQRIQWALWIQFHWLHLFQLLGQKVGIFNFEKLLAEI